MTATLDFISSVPYFTGLDGSVLKAIGRHVFERKAERVRLFALSEVLGLDVDPIPGVFGAIEAVTLDGLTLDGASQPLPQNRGVVNLTGANGVRISDCAVLGAAGNGIALLDDGAKGALVTCYGGGAPTSFKGVPGSIRYIPPRALD